MKLASKGTNKFEKAKNLANKINLVSFLQFQFQEWQKQNHLAPSNLIFSISEVIIFVQYGGKSDYTEFVQKFQFGQCHAI